MKQLNKKVLAALYMRLSRDDDEYGDSISIETQRNILVDFAREQGFTIVDEYVDDGWSGTNFNRPNFKRMMEDVNAGKVNCVITKDLSRFGREHIQMDYYLEFMFPEQGIRYIAVTDNEDTERGLSDFVPFKNLFNEWFAKDTSRKVKAAFKAKFQKGERIFSTPPFGYQRDPAIKNRLVVDEETAPIVREIFDMALHGAGAAKICHQLIEREVPVPAWFAYRRSGSFAKVFKDQPESKRYTWTVNAVKSILKDETYIGNTVHYQQVSVSFKSKKRRRTSEEEWLRLEGTHEGLVSKEDFEQVQKMIAVRRRAQKDKTTQIFAGLVRCADCGWSMRYAVNRGVKNPFGYFVCTKYAQGTGQCFNHYVRYDMLYAFVLSRLQYWAQEAQRDEEELLQRLLMVEDEEAAAANQAAVRALNEAEKRLKKLDSYLKLVYEDRVEGKITERCFTRLSAEYQAEQAELESKISDLQNKLETEKASRNNAEKWVEVIKQYTDLSELTAPLLNSLIDKIVVHEAVKHEDGTKEQEIEIYYKFIGKIDEVQEHASLTA